MQPAAILEWIMTVEYVGVLPSDCQGDGDPGDARVNPLAISRIGDRLTLLSASVATATEQEAREIGLIGIGRWAGQIGLDPDNATAMALFIRDAAS
jgi:hypothetical protein